MSQLTTKFGEMLIQEQFITAAQLGDALRWQVLYGVRLGRALIEMGYVSESVIGEMLSRKHGVPSVGRAEMLSLDQQTISLIPSEIAVMHRAVPLGMNGRQLRVAMSDPHDRQALDLIAQETGTVVQPLVSPDLLTCIALEKYYGNRCSRNVLPMPRTGSIMPEPSALNRPQQEYSFCSQIATEGIPVEVLPNDIDESAEDPFEHQPEPEANNGVIEIDPLAAQLASARNREDVADATIEALAPKFQAAALVMIRGNEMVAWRASSSSHTISCCNGVTMRPGTSTPLKATIAGLGYLGEFLPLPDHRPMFDVLQLPPSISFLSVPITIHKRPVAAILAWSDQKKLESEKDKLEAMSHKIAMSLQMLMLRSKILSS